LCTIAEGQEYRRKLTDFQTSAMIKVAATPADVRKRKILDSVNGMQFAQDQYAQHFGISVDTQMAKITGEHMFSKLILSLKRLSVKLQKPK
jgi:hypothetical protein